MTCVLQNMKNKYLKFLLLICFIANNSRVYSFEVDSITKQCYQNEVKYTPIMVDFISNNQVDSVEMLFNNMPKMCEEQGWNQLINLFLICVKYPEKIDFLTENEMGFLIDYTYSIQYNEIKYQPKDTSYYDYDIMPTFNELHQAVQTYLTSFYETIPTGTKRHNLVGSLLNKNNSFFERLNKESFAYNSSLTYKSLTAYKNMLDTLPHIFLHVKTSYSLANKFGNALIFEPLGLEVFQKNNSFGLTIGYGINTQPPAFTYNYEGQIITPPNTSFFVFSTWVNHVFYKYKRINPYVGAGLSFFDSQLESPEKNGKKIKVSTYGAQAYPEIGLVFGKKSNHWLKIHCGYYLTAYGVDYADEKWFFFSDFENNLSGNHFRFGFSVLINLFPIHKQKGKLIGLY